MKKFFESRLNRLTYGSVILMVAVFISLAMRGGVAANFGPHGSLAYYFSVSSKSFSYILAGAAYFAVVFLALLVGVSIVKNFVNLARGSKTPPTMVGSKTLKGAVKNTWDKVGPAVAAMAPSIFFITIMSFALDSLNSINKTKLMDVALVNGERSILGTYGFMVFAGAHYPILFAKFIILSFENMSGMLLAGALVIAYINVRVLRELSAAFCFGMLLMVPIWFLFPALSPQDRFLTNAYHLPIAAPIAAIEANFHPVAPIADFLTTVEVGKSTLVDRPTSTLPSAHAAWAVFTGYYLFMAQGDKPWKRRWIGWIVLPFLIASTLGTVILAQHYLFDPIIGTAIAAGAIYVVDKLVKMDRSHAAKTLPVDF